MNDMILEALVQKNNTVIQELYNQNLLIRSLPPTTEIMSNLHARIDAMQSSLLAMEKAMKRDNDKIKILEDTILNQNLQISQLREITEGLNKTIREQAANYLQSQKSVLKTVEQKGEKFESEFAAQIISIQSKLFFGRAIMVLAGAALVIFILVKVR